jgi:hypothetical protein
MRVGQCLYQRYAFFSPYTGAGLPMDETVSLFLDEFKRTMTTDQIAAKKYR